MCLGSKIASVPLGVKNNYSKGEYIAITIVSADFVIAQVQYFGA